MEVREAITSRIRAASEPLGIYLNDHLAGATGGLELARRTAASQRRSPAGPELDRLEAEIGDDRAELLEIMGRLGVQVRQYKVQAAWLAEKAGRLKPNGKVVGGSPLSDLVELEGLRMGVEGKAAGWRALRRLAERDPRLDTARLDELISRAGRQSEILEGLRERAVDKAFPGDGERT